jgi:peptidoglycan-associated lipoprotein
MKPIKFTNLMVLGMAISMAACGCKKTPVGVTNLPGSKTGAPADQGRGGLAKADDGTGSRLPSETPPSSITPPPANPEGTPPNPPGSHDGWAKNNEILQVDTVYFDFDSAVVKESEKSKVAAVADYLKANGTVAVLVEGNCDERGTEEYNRALGDRRALAVREELIALGIVATRVDTITYGKDKPADPGHDDAAWKKNRRDDFVVLTPPLSANR